MIDIHTHVVPNVDDGSRSFDESLEMIEKMINDGIKKIYATSHFQSPATRAKREVQVSQFEVLKEKAKHLDVELILGAEIFYRADLNPNYDELTLGDTKYLLVEFHWSRYNNVSEAIYNFSRSGYKPIVAHVERYPYLNKQDYKDIKDNGGLLQINSSSILGERGRTEQRICRYLLKHKLVDFVASDAHRIDRRTPNLKEAYDYLEDRIDKGYLDQIFKTNQENIK